MITEFPQRIISMVPSQTELLFDLGLADRIVGITKFCVHPGDLCRRKEKIGGTRNLNLFKIKQLQPDLLIANKEENDEKQVQELMKNYPVWISDVKTMQDALEMIEQVAAMTGTADRATQMINAIQNAFDGLNNETPEKTVAYLIWKDPMMVAGGQTFITAMLENAGFSNVFSDLPRYPAVYMAELKERNPDIILLSTEPYPFSENHMNEMQAKIPGSKVVLVDGEMFSWYGSRLILSADYLRRLRDTL